MVGMFVGLHVLLADRTNCPELAIGMDEGQAFMGAAQNVLRHYSVETTQKAADWVAFAGIAGGMYLTRGVAIANRLRQEKAERYAEAGGQVLRFRRHGVAPAPMSEPQAAPMPPAGADLAGLHIEPGMGGFQEAAE